MEKDQRMTDEVQQRRAVIEELKAADVDVFGSRYDRTHEAAQATRLYEEAEAAGKQGDLPSNWRLAGRLMQRRGMGKAGFGNIQDLSGRMQLYVRQDAVLHQPA